MYPNSTHEHNYIIHVSMGDCYMYICIGTCSSLHVHVPTYITLVYYIYFQYNYNIEIIYHESV